MAALLALAALGSAPVRAAYVPWGTVLVPGSAWAGPSASMGDLNVYSNGDGNEDQYGRYGLDYECFELAARWATIRFGAVGWGVGYAYQMYAAGPRLNVPMIQHPNGGDSAPEFGDLLIFDQTSYDVAGHVAVVAGTGPGWVDIVEQNWGNQAPTGRARLAIDASNYMQPRWGLPIIGWLRASNRPPGLEGTEGPGGFTVDQSAHVYPYGSAETVNEQPLWTTTSPVRGLLRTSDGGSGYILDGGGQLHPFGGALPFKTPPLWRGQDVARGAVLTPDGGGFYVVDEWGSIHAFGDAPAMAASTTWPGKDQARAITLRSDGTGGYVLDASGGLHQFGAAPRIRVATGSWPGQDRARGLVLREDNQSGWVIDSEGALYSFNGAPGEFPRTTYPGQDMGRAVLPYDADGGFVVDADGLVQPFGDAPDVTQGQRFSGSALTAAA